MKKFIYLAIFSVVIYLGGNKIYLLAAPAVLPMPEAKVGEVVGIAQYKSVDSKDWAVIAKDQTIQLNDLIKTGSSSRLVLNFYDNSVVRLDSNSEAMINKLVIDKNNTANNKVGLKLNIGRIWARIVNLADREASFEVEADNTVATVRGTTLSFANDNAGNVTMDTIDSLVEYQVLDRKDRNKIVEKIQVQKGRSVSYMAGRASLATSSAELLDSEWYKDNDTQDKRFDEDLKRHDMELNKMIVGSIAPDSKLYKLKLFSEKLQAALMKDQTAKDRLNADFLNRRLAESEAMAEAGQDGLAGMLSKQFEVGVKNLTADLKERGADKAGIEQKIQGQINLQKRLSVDLTPADKAFDAKKTLFELELDLARDQEQKNYLLMKQAEDYLHGAKKIEKLDPTDHKKLMDDYNLKLKALPNESGEKYFKRLQLIEKSLDDLKVDGLQKTNKLPGLASSTDAIKSILKQALDKAADINDVQKKAVEGANKIIEQVQPLVNQKLPSVPPVAPIVPVQSNEPLSETKAPIPPVEKSRPVSVSIGGAPTAMVPSEGRKLRALVKYSDGSILDKTAEASWSVSGDLGTISDGYLKASADSGAGGAVTVTVTINGATLTASTREILVLGIM